MERRARDPSARSAVQRLAPRWAAYWPDLDAGAAARDVLARLEDAIATWGLRDAAVLGGGIVALVCAARRRGSPVVVKVHARGHPEEPELRAEAAALRFWQPTGAVPELLDTRDGGLTILLERLVPGTALDEAGTSFDTRLTVLGRLAARLHGAGLPPADAPPIAAYARSWRGALATDAAALAELDVLLRPAPTDVLVHADLHGGNALRGGRGWTAIDPHAARGDRHADVWALLDPLVPALPGAPAAAPRTARGWIARYAAAADLDPARTAAWTWVRARVTARQLATRAAPAPEDRGWAERLRRMAEALR